MTTDKLSQTLKQEAEGIMFPFRNKVKPVSDTTQEAYNTATDGIMSVKGKKYIGPDSVIQYGDSYQRQLKQIEKGMLPQFDQQQFPDVGEGIVEDRGFPKAQPVDTTPVQPDEPTFDPCPPGFKLINGVCQPIEQDRGRGDRPPPQGPKIVNGIIEGFEDLDLQGVDVRTGDFYNRLSPEMKAEYDRASKYGRGLQVKFGPDGEPIRIVAKSPTILQALAEMNIFANVLKSLSSKEEVKENTVKETSDKIINLIDQEATAADATDTTATGTVDSGFQEQPSDLFGEITTIDLKDSKTGETVSTVNKRFTDNITTGHFRLSNTLATITNLQNRIKSGVKDGRDPSPNLLETAKDVAEKEFNETIQEDSDKGNNSLSKSQKNYLDSDNRRALPGETKSSNGKDVDNRKGFVSGRENEGYGFRSTSANYNKSTNTFDQRFK